ncbi:MAG: hypothetical protein WA821_22930, partial [Anaerolineales bacterium]
MSGKKSKLCATAFIISLPVFASARRGGVHRNCQTNKIKKIMENAIMDYVSTRSNYTLAASSHVMKIGIAPDGGLFVPEKVAPVSLEQIKSFAGMGFQQRAVQILKSYLDDYSLSELDECVKYAY